MTLVWIPGLIIIDFYDFIPVYPSVFVSISRYIKHLRLFHRISKHIEYRQKYTATRHIFNSLLCVWKLDETANFGPSKKNYAGHLLSEMTF